MIDQHPLGYLLGLEGVALLKAFGGAYDRDFTIARIDEVRRLLDEAERLGTGASAQPLDTEAGYRDWAPYYDQPDNQMIDLEQPVVRAILDELPPGVALDAACGTGRHAAYLQDLGHRVVGVDSSPDMLAVARDKLPDVDFHQADLTSLPLADDEVDLVVCGLALMHVGDLAPVLAEFARVLKPRGHLVVSDARGLLGDLPIPVIRTGSDGRPGYLPQHIRRTSEYLGVALSLGFEVRSCEEPVRPSPLVDDDDIPAADGDPAPVPLAGEPPDIWSLHELCAEAANAAYRDSPAAIVLHFQLGGGGS